jgi:hypothetical protein
MSPSRRKSKLCYRPKKTAFYVASALERNSEAIAAGATRFAKNAKRALNSRSALCLPHFAMLVGEIEDADTMSKIIARQAMIFERLSEDMKRYALKHDAIRRALASAEEETAAERALSALAAHRNINTACKME